MRRLNFPALWALAVLSVVTVSVPATRADDGSQIAAADKPMAAAPRMDAIRLRGEGFDSALAGDFPKALAQLKAAAKADPSDAVCAKAVRLLEEHGEVAERAAARRQAEYDNCVKRVGYMKLAQLHSEKADPNELKKLRKAVKAVSKAYNDNGAADTLEISSDANAVAKDRRTSIDALERALKALDEAVVLIKEDHGEYAAAFREIAEQGRTLMSRHLAGWKELDANDPDAWRAVSRELKEIEYDEIDALGDFESMVYSKPWRVGLIQARLASRLTADRERMAREAWFQKLVSETEARGKLCVQDAKWYDALSCYSALQELLPDNTEHEKNVKIVTRHVHVLSMYGGPDALSEGAEDDEDGEEPETLPSPDNPGSDEDSDDEPDWQEMVANVDADMVEKVIGQLDLTYVSAVDYRKVTKGGLMSVKVLAETPQASYSFEGLKDKGDLKQFLSAIDRQIRDVETRDRVTHLDLILALNSVLHASEKSVKIPTEVLAVEFADGFLNELDKFSSMIWPSDVVNFRKATMGQFYGVGVQITKEPGEPLKVVTPLPGTPAFKAGIQAGDLITKVDGKPTMKLSVDKLIKMIMGDKDTAVELTIRRGGAEKVYRIVRDEIEIRTVKGWRSLPQGEWDYLVDPKDKIGYLRVTQFTGETREAIRDVLDGFRDKGVTSMILDLRFNPGGLLRSATGVSDEFLKSGRIVSTRGRHTRPANLNAGPGGQFLDGDLIVLVNQYSASAAEIVSGALQDWNRAVIVGQRTYGKGSVQNVIPLSSHSALLKLTTAYYYLPKGRLLHRTPGAKKWGVDPDVEVFLSPRETRRWLDIRRKTDIFQDDELGQLAGELARQYEADTQLSTAVLMLKLAKLRAAAGANPA